MTGDIKGNDKITVILMKDSAHHLELRAPDDADPQDVKDARTLIATTIGKWITEYFTPPTYYQ